MSTFGKFIKNTLRSLWYFRRHIPILNLPIPFFLYRGFWFLIYPDEMGLNLVPFPWRKTQFEEYEWKFLSKLIKQDWTCFDVGANQGLYTVFLTKMTGLQGKVYAFEPVSFELEKLKRNLRINQLSLSEGKNLVLENMAVGSQDGMVNMNVCLDGHGSRSSLREPPEEVKAKIKIENVPITTLDSYVNQHKINNVDFIKIDIEGGELDMLKGSTKVLTALRPIIMIEVADTITQQFGYKSVEIYNYLKKCNYEFFEVNSDGFLIRLNPKDKYRQNLIVVPNEKLNDIFNFVKI